jgi:hypothetical protein
MLSEEGREKILKKEQDFANFGFVREDF